MQYLPHQQRVVDEKAEKAELDLKRQKLEDFLLKSPIYNTLAMSEKLLLVEQERVMTLYSEILGKRIDAFCDPNEPF